MPAFAPLLRPVFVCVLTDLPVAVVGAALGGPDDDEEDDEDEDEVAAAADADHVVAERSDLQVVLQVNIYSLK